ncbi:MAG: hypothetical protein K0R82_2943, partial [Flavipsychrobacter sp.]|nr:hypothetical protein [Flavipsychrobacter sp.]
MGMYTVRFMILLFVCVPACSHAQLVIGEDTLRGNIRRMTEYIHHWDYKVKTVYTWDVANRLITGQIGDSEHKQKGRELFKYDDHNRLLETGLYCGDNTLCMGASYQYDSKGQKTGERHVNAVQGCCQQLRDWVGATLSNWVSGARWLSVSVTTYTYDDAGNILKERGESFNVIEDPANETEKLVAASVGKDTSIFLRTYSYDPMGHVTE